MVTDIAVSTVILAICLGFWAYLSKPKPLPVYDACELMAIQEVQRDLGSVEGFPKSDRIPTDQVRLGKATWKNADHDEPVMVTGYLGEYNGRKYASIEGSTTGVPLDEIEYNNFASFTIGQQQVSNQVIAEAFQAYSRAMNPGLHTQPQQQSYAHQLAYDRQLRQYWDGVYNNPRQQPPGIQQCTAYLQNMLSGYDTAFIPPQEKPE